MAIEDGNEEAVETKNQRKIDTVLQINSLFNISFIFIFYFFSGGGLLKAQRASGEGEGILTSSFFFLFSFFVLSLYGLVCAHFGFFFFSHNVLRPPQRQES